MRWLCWISPHKWIEGLDSENLMCERCPKIKRKPKTLPPLPHGTVSCPYPDCQNWCAPPPFLNKNGLEIRIKDSRCSHCKRKIRWNRVKDSLGYCKDRWHAPSAIEEENSV